MVVMDGVEMVDVHEAARLTGRSSETVRRWIWTGRVRAVKQGNKYFLAKSELPATASSHGDAEGLSLVDWVRRVEQTFVREPGTNSSADLIFEDRAERASR